MGRKPVPQPLTLADTAAVGENPPSTSETLPVSSTPDSATSRSPRSPFKLGQKRAGQRQPVQPSDVPPHQQQLPEESQHTPTSFAHSHSNLDSPSSQLQGQQQRQRQHVSQEQQQQQQQQQQQPFQPHHHGHGHRRKEEDKASKSGFFFHFVRSSERLNTHHANSRREIISRDKDRPMTSGQNLKHSESAYAGHAPQKSFPTVPSKSDSALGSGEYDAPDDTRKSKPKPFTILSRTRSVREDTADSQEPSPVSIQVAEPDSPPANPMPLRTAPLQAHDRTFRDMMSSAARNNPAERPHGKDMYGTKGRDHEREHNRAQATVRDSGGSTFFSGLRSSSSKAADMISKGLFGKTSRSGSTTERESLVDDEHYILRVINLPLVEQTRRTRISKRLEHSQDKTEFWMPAFPWRAIDYLNYKGCHVEGLYRVPGSGPQIKKWQRKFDEEGDVDLFAQKDLYDINIIGSMLKAWLRELPDELFPKESQERVARECAGSATVPQLLIEELSKLPPFNYYLLFAITCHLSLLLAHSDKNKMDFRNLCICFQPCMKIDAFCFRFLVCEWHDCWKGCKNEAMYIEQEYALFDEPPPQVIGSPQRSASLEETSEGRNVSSSGSSNQSSHDGDSQQSRSAEQTLPAAENGNESTETSSIVSTAMSANSERDAAPRMASIIRPLSPIQPLSPLGFGGEGFRDTF